MPINQDYISLAALMVSVVALLLSMRSWSRQFRPIVTAAVKTNNAGSLSTAFDLNIQNSGAIPARNITLHIHDQRQLENALNKAPDSERELFLFCFKPELRIPILQNGSDTSCSFGYVGSNGSGFWKPHSEFDILIRYEGWFGKIYCERQRLKIADSFSFTGRGWGGPKTKQAQHGRDKC